MSQIATHNMNALIDIAVTLAFFVFLVVGVAATGRTLTLAASILSSLRRRGCVSATAKELGNAKSARRAFVRHSEAETRPFGGILIHHPEVRVIPSHSAEVKLS